VELPQAATWNSLEVVKLLVAALTPILVVVAGFWLNRRLRSLEQAQWSQQKVIERRIKAYDELARPLNQMFCFYCYVGGWKEFKPPDLVRMKRELDQTAHISAPLFNAEFLQRYDHLMDICFATFNKWGDDAKLRTLPDRREDAAGEEWSPSWSQCFVDREEASEPEDVKKAYSELMAYLARAIGATEVDAHLLGKTQLPGNFDSRAAGMVSRIHPRPDVKET
jgi:hypothetical protein